MLCINVGERRENRLGCGGVALSVGLVLNVTGKIGKAFNVMQYLSNNPIKIRPNQSLPAGHIHIRAAEPPSCRCSPTAVCMLLFF